MSRRPARTIAGALVALGLATTLAACGADQEDDMTELRRTAEARADEARALIDELAARVGTDPEVSVDTLTACTPGDDDSGLMLTYSVFVTTEGDASSRLPGLAEEYEADGWEPRLDSDRELRLIKDPVSMGVTVRPAESRANVSGSGGCVR